MLNVKNMRFLTFGVNFTPLLKNRNEISPGDEFHPEKHVSFSVPMITLLL